MKISREVLYKFELDDFTVLALDHLFDSLSYSQVLELVGGDEVKAAALSDFLAELTRVIAKGRD